MLSYAGTIKNARIEKLFVGHANDKNCRTPISFHVHPQEYICSVGPSAKDAVFFNQTKNYNFKFHLIFTKYGIWKLIPKINATKQDLSNFYKLFKAFESHNCTRYKTYENHVNNLIHTIKQNGYNKYFKFIKNNENIINIIEFTKCNKETIELLQLITQLS